jgi:hypothetical protein
MYNIRQKSDTNAIRDFLSLDGKAQHMSEKGYIFNKDLLSLDGNIQHTSEKRYKCNKGFAVPGW